MAMAMGNYRKVLALPGVSMLLGLMFVARIPVSATSMVLTLHVVLHLHEGYGAAGLVGAAGTIGIAIGAPLTGRIVDRFGLRPMVAITTLGYGLYWLVSWMLPYGPLLVLSFVGGVLALPVMSVGRQSLAALVPEQHRRVAYSLDSISVEMSFMVGPAVGVLLATKASTVIAMISVGCLILLVGALMYVVNPPVRGAHDAAEADLSRPPRRVWLRPALLATLAAGCGAVFVLSGTEVSAVAALRGVGEVGWMGVVTIAMCVASMVGGIIYGALRRSPGPLVLMVLLGVLMVPGGVAGGQWWVLCLMLFPGNLMCAPTLAATGDRVSRLAPVAVRGEAMGLHSSALTMGGALGSPLVGIAVDRLGPAAGFAAAGLGGILIALVAWPLARRDPIAPEQTEPDEDDEPAADPVVELASPADCR